MKKSAPVSFSATVKTESGTEMKLISNKLNVISLKTWPVDDDGIVSREQFLEIYK